MVTSSSMWWERRRSAESPVGPPDQLYVQFVDGGPYSTSSYVLFALLGAQRMQVRSYLRLDDALFVEQEVENFLGITNQAVNNSFFRPGLGIHPDTPATFGPLQRPSNGPLPIIDPNAPHQLEPIPVSQPVTTDVFYVVASGDLLVSVHATTEDANRTIASLRDQGFMDEYVIRSARFA